jgi:hypothetical protein
MRIAVLIITLILMLVLFLQSCTVMVGGEILGEEETSGAGALGIFMALLFVIGAAFVIGKPKVSMITFIIAGVFGLMGATGSDFSDLWIWTVVSFIMAGLAHLGVRELRNREPKQEPETSESTAT